ncbi:GNAT family N-acetyltransferase [Brevibacterium casei]|nr:GNAT family N-acetyltransferase [Brevibacterium casei]
MTRRADAAATLGRRIRRWERDGLEMWMVRERASGPIIGFCGCDLRGGTEAEPKGPDSFWNLGYRFSPEAQGRGLATAVSAAGHRPRAGGRPRASGRCLPPRAQHGLGQGRREGRPAAPTPRSGRRQPRSRGCATRLRRSGAHARALAATLR